MKEIAIFMGMWHPSLQYFIVYMKIHRLQLNKKKKRKGYSQIAQYIIRLTLNLMTLHMYQILIRPLASNLEVLLEDSRLYFTK